jgi:multicomponent Na+:H+ antiporter subunit A
MLAGFLLLGLVGGSFEISELDRIAVRQSELYLPILVLVLAGAFTKSAQFPFHFWLPNAMAAPTPVSAYLHSATMVKAGIYLMARMHPTLGETDVWVWTLTIFGAITAVWASILALKQTDLKLMMAYTTLMALGTLTMFLGAESEVALTAVATFILVHGLYKAALFMVVGNLDHEAGSRFLPDLAGMRRAMPITAIAAGAAAFSMAGFPPFLGFIGKELKYKGALAVASEPTLVAMTAVAANAMMVGVAAVIAFRPFFGTARAPAARPHEAPIGMWIGPATLAALGLVFGLFPERAAGPLVVPAVEAIRALPGAYPLKLWHGVNLPLMMSIGTVALGALLFWQFDRVAGGLRRATASLATADGLYDRTMAGMLAVAEWQSRLLQNGRQRRYVLIVFTTLTVSVGGTLIVKGGVVWPERLPAMDWYEWLVAAIVVVGTLLAVIARSRLAAIGAVGVIGTSVALIFVMYGAADVAMTQLMVEILIVVIVAMVLLRLPGFHSVDHPGRLGRIRDAVVAIATGTTMTLVLLSVSHGPIDRRLTTYFEEMSVPGGFGRNIVNVILVDFRAIDTFGEIAVVAIAGLACWALIRLRPGKRSDSADGPEPSAPAE